MRILHIIGSADLRHGGPIEALRLCAFELAKFGHVSEVVSLDAPDTLGLQDSGVKTYGVGPGRKPFGQTPALARFIRDNAQNYDVAVMHGLWNYSLIGGWKGLKASNIPYVLFTHGMMDPYFKKAYPLKHIAKQVVWWVIQSKVVEDAFTALFTCEEERILARACFGKVHYNERVVAFGAAAPPDYNPTQTKAFKTACPNLKGRPYLLFLSRIHPKKGVDLLVEAFCKLAEDYPELDLVIAGPDQTGMMQDLKLMSENAGLNHRIHWPGMLVADAKWGAFLGCEAFILPSHQENFGIVIAEAMACHKPVLITDKINIWREIASSGGGIVRNDDLNGTQDLIHTFFSLSPAARETMGQKAREGYLKHFSVPEAAQDLLSVLQETLATHKETKPTHDT
jgi:glycosyltransferase involved in cell wall biosynthesis